MSTSADFKHTRVGTSAIITRADGKVIVGKRIGSHGAGTWQFPGGHIDKGEGFFECAERETLEETGLEVKAQRVVAVTNDMFEEPGKHYLTVFVKCEMVDPNAEPELKEVNKCEGWHWKSPAEIVEWVKNHDSKDEKHADKCFLPIVNLVNQPAAEIAKAEPSPWSSSA